jgi:hypothetical protein
MGQGQSGREDKTVRFSQSGESSVQFRNQLGWDLPLVQSAWVGRSSTLSTSDVIQQSSGICT